MMKRRMRTMINAMRSAHRFLARHAFYQLVGCSALAVGLLAGRMYLATLSQL